MNTQNTQMESAACPLQWMGGGVEVQYQLCADFVPIIAHLLGVRVWLRARSTAAPGAGLWAGRARRNSTDRPSQASTAHVPAYATAKIYSDAFHNTWLARGLIDYSKVEMGSIKKDFIHLVCSHDLVLDKFVIVSYKQAKDTTVNL